MSAAKIIGIAVKTATIRELAHERLVLEWQIFEISYIPKVRLPYMLHIVFNLFLPLWIYDYHII